MSAPGADSASVREHARLAGGRGQRLIRRILVPVLSMYVALLIEFTFIVFPGVNGNPYAMFPDMVYGRAHRPYVMRALLPTAIRIAASLVPESARMRAISAARRDRNLGVAVPLLRWEWEYLPEYGIGAALQAGCFLGYAFLLRFLVRKLYSFPGWVADIVPVIGLLIIPAFYRYYNYLYDPGALLTFTMALACIVAGREWWYYPCFALAAFNKETSILLAGLFLLWNTRRKPKRSLALHVAAQLAVWAAVRAFLTWAYRGNPGPLLEVHLFDRTASYLDHLGRLIGFIVFAVFWTALIVPGWRRAPHFLRAGLAATLLPLVGLALVFGFVDETRGYYEAVPFLVLLLAPTVTAALGVSEEGSRPGSGPGAG